MNSSNPVSVIDGWSLCFHVRNFPACHGFPDRGGSVGVITSKIDRRRFGCVGIVWSIFSLPRGVLQCLILAICFSFSCGLVGWMISDRCSPFGGLFLWRRLDFRHDAYREDGLQS